MKLIKLFEQFIREETETAETAVTAIKSTLTPAEQAVKKYLSDSSTEFNPALGISVIPAEFENPDNSLEKWGYRPITQTELKQFVDHFDFPQWENDPSWNLDFIERGGNSSKAGPLAVRYTVVKKPGKGGATATYYPAVEELRVMYNKDEGGFTSLESLFSATLPSAVGSDKIQKALLKCYVDWQAILSKATLAATIPVPSGDVSLLPSKSPVNEGTITDITGKSELIQILRDKIISMEKGDGFSAIAVAQTIYNNCAQFMNKTNIFLDKTKYGPAITKPAASSAPTEVISTATPEPTTPGPATVGPATPAPATGGPTSAN